MMFDCSRNKKQQDLQFLTNLTVFVLYKTLQNEDPLQNRFEIAWKGSKMILDRRRNRKKQKLRVLANLTCKTELTFSLRARPAK